MSCPTPKKEGTTLQMISGNTSRKGIDSLLESLWRQKLAYATNIDMATKMQLEEIAAASVEGLVPGNLYDVNQSLSEALEGMLDRRYCTDCIMVNEDVESQVEKLKSTLGAKRFKVFTVFHLLLRLYRIAEHVRNRPSTSLPLLLVDNARRHWVFVYRILRLDAMCQQRILDRWLGDISEPTVSRQHSSEVCEHLKQTLSYLLADEEGSYITTAEEPAYRERFKNVLMSLLERNNNNQESVTSEPTTESLPITMCECDTNATSYITVKQMLDSYFTHYSDEDIESDSQSDSQVEINDKPIPLRVVSSKTSTQDVSPVDSGAKDLGTREQEAAIELQQSPRKITTELTATRRSPRKNAAILVSPQPVKSPDTPRPRIREGTPLSEGSPVPNPTTEPIVTIQSPRKNTAIPLLPQPVKSPNKLRPRIHEGTPLSVGFPLPVPTSSNTKQKDSARKTNTAITSRTSRQRNASVTSKLAALVRRRKVKQTQVRHTWKRRQPSINTAKLTIKQLNEHRRSTCSSPKKKIKKSKSSSQNSRIDPSSKRNIRRIATMLDAVILDEVLNEPTQNAEASDGRRTRSRNTHRSSPQHSGTGNQTTTADLSGSKRASSGITTGKRSQTLNVSNNATVGSATESPKLNGSSLSSQSCSPRLDRSCHSSQSTSHTRPRSVSPADFTLETGEFLQMIVTSAGESFSSRSPANHRSPTRHDSPLANDGSPTSHRALASQRISPGGSSPVSNMSLTRSRSPASHKSQVNRRSTAHERSLSRNRSQASPKTPASNRSPASHKSPIIHNSSAYQSSPASHSSATSSRSPASHQTPVSKRTRSPDRHAGMVMTPGNDSGRTTRQSKTPDHKQSRSAGDIRRRKSSTLTALVADNTGISFLSASSQTSTAHERSLSRNRSQASPKTPTSNRSPASPKTPIIHNSSAYQSLPASHSSATSSRSPASHQTPVSKRTRSPARHAGVVMTPGNDSGRTTRQSKTPDHNRSRSVGDIRRRKSSTLTALVADNTGISFLSASSQTVDSSPNRASADVRSDVAADMRSDVAADVRSDVAADKTSNVAVFGKGYKWTVEEDRALYRLIVPYTRSKREIDFEEVAKVLPHRSADSLRNHWVRLRKRKAYLQYTVKVSDDSVQKSITTPSVSKPARPVKSAVVACMTRSTYASPSEVTLTDVVSVDVTSQVPSAGATPEVLAEDPMSAEVTAAEVTSEVTTADHMSADVTTQGSKSVNKWSLKDDIKLYKIVTQ